MAYDRDQTRTVTAERYERLKRWSQRKPCVALMGEFSAGKSTLLNFLIEAELLPTRATATELPPVWFSHGDEGSYWVDADGQRHDLDPADLHKVSLQARYIRLYTRSEILEHCDIIDTPGISDPNLLTDSWRFAAAQAHMVLWCSTATQAWRETERGVWLSLPERLRAHSVLVVTRADKLVTPADRDKVARRLMRETGDLFNGLVFMSAPNAVKAKATLGEDGTSPQWEASGAAALLDKLAEEFEAIYAERTRTFERYAIEGSGPRRVVLEGVEDGAGGAVPRRPVRPDGGRRHERPSAEDSADWLNNVHLETIGGATGAAGSMPMFARSAEAEIEHTAEAAGAEHAEAPEEATVEADADFDAALARATEVSRPWEDARPYVLTNSVAAPVARDDAPEATPETDGDAPAAEAEPVSEAEPAVEIEAAAAMDDGEGASTEDDATLADTEDEAGATSPDTAPDEGKDPNGETEGAAADIWASAFPGLSDSGTDEPEEAADAAAAGDDALGDDVGDLPASEVSGETGVALEADGEATDGPADEVEAEAAVLGAEGAEAPFGEDAEHDAPADQATAEVAEADAPEAALHGFETDADGDAVPEAAMAEEPEAAASPGDEPAESPAAVAPEPVTMASAAVPDAVRVWRAIVAAGPAAPSPADVIAMVERLLFEMAEPGEVSGEVSAPVEVDEAEDEPVAVAEAADEPAEAGETEAADGSEAGEVAGTEDDVAVEGEPAAAFGEDDGSGDGSDPSAEASDEAINGSPPRSDEPRSQWRRLA